MTAGVEGAAMVEARGARTSFGLLARSYIVRKYYFFGWSVRRRAAFTRYDFCQAMDAMSLGAARGFAARGVPVLLDLNEIPDPFERQGRHFVDAPSLAKRHLSAAFARDIAAATRVIATSESMADFAAERYGRQAVAIRNARAPLAEAPSSAIRDDAGGDPAHKIIVYPCTAAPHLGVESAIAMLSCLPDEYRLVFVGRFVTPSYREEIERLIRRHGLQRRVVLKGEIAGPDYLLYLAGADMGLVPLGFAYRNQRVVLPWRVIDLAAAGVPMVATRSDEIDRLARRCDLGEIVGDANPEELATAVRMLASVSVERRLRIRDDLRGLADDFAPDREMARYRAILGELATRRTGRAAFVVNLALRNNRRVVGFVDAICAMGWRVDLYCVRAPSRDLFAAPDKIRFVEIPDRLLPRWLRIPSAIQPRLPRFPRIAGIGFGLTLLGRARRFARAIRRETMRQGRWDIVVASDLFASPAALAATRGTGTVIYDACEIPDLTQRTSPSLRSVPAPLLWWFGRWERAAIRRAALILAPSGAMARYLRRRYRCRANASVMAWRASYEVLAPGSDRSLRDLLGLPESDVILVSPCGISRETGATVAVQTLRFLPADHVLVFIGRFSSRRAEADIRDVVRRERMAHRCFFVGELPYPLYRRYLGECDLGLVLFDTGIANMRLAMPNRVTDMIAAGLPMVTTEIEDVAGVIRRAGLGAVLRERRPAIVARAVRETCERLGIDQGGSIAIAARRRLDRVARFRARDDDTARLVAAIEARIGTLQGKRVALLTLRSAFSNRRFLRLAAVLADSGATVAAFDSDIGLAPGAGNPLPWLTTIAIR